MPRPSSAISRPRPTGPRGCAPSPGWPATSPATRSRRSSRKRRSKQRHWRRFRQSRQPRRPSRPRAITAGAPRIRVRAAPHERCATIVTSTTPKTSAPPAGQSARRTADDWYPVRGRSPGSAGADYPEISPASSWTGVLEPPGISTFNGARKNGLLLGAALAGTNGDFAPEEIGPWRSSVPRADAADGASRATVGAGLELAEELVSISGLDCSRAATALRTSTTETDAIRPASYADGASRWRIRCRSRWTPSFVSGRTVDHHRS